MKQVSYQDLKRNLSSLLDEAAAGEDVLVTRHNKPTAWLRPPRSPAVRVGTRFGRGALKPLLANATAGLYLEILRDDRQDGERGAGQAELFANVHQRGKRPGGGGGR